MFIIREGVHMPVLRSDAYELVFLTYCLAHVKDLTKSED
jgi:hypothetical protein